jgi:hypothetical protein
MTAQEFILQKLEHLNDPSVQKTIPDTELADFIFKAVMNKHFRKYSVTPEYFEKIKIAININLEKNEPIKFSFPFGAYKLWRLEETPETDWAELFTLMYYTEWLMPIAKIYKPGIWFDFSSDEIIVERMNNIPTSETESYAKSFNSVLNFLQSYLPKNIKYSLTPVRSLYTPKEFENDLKDKIKKMEEKLGGLPTLDDKHKHMVELNVKLKPEQDKDPKWREKIELIHQAYYTVDRRRPYNRAKEKIITFVTKMSDCVAVGTTKSSIAKFWVGVGALKKQNNTFMEYVLSPSQIEKTQFIWEPIKIEGLTGKNFHQIRVF